MIEVDSLKVKIIFLSQDLKHHGSAFFNKRFPDGQFSFKN